MWFIPVVGLVALAAWSIRRKRGALIGDQAAYALEVINRIKAGTYVGSAQADVALTGALLVGATDSAKFLSDYAHWIYEYEEVTGVRTGRANVAAEEAFEAGVYFRGISRTRWTRTRTARNSTTSKASSNQSNEQDKEKRS